MKNSKNNKRLNDIILIGILILIPVVMLLFGLIGNESEGTLVVITVDGVEYETVSLSDNRDIKIETDAGFNIVRISEGSVSIIDADCPDRLCVNHIAISKAGEQIVCLPHKVVVTVTGESDGGIDSISH